MDLDSECCPFCELVPVYRRTILSVKIIVFLVTQKLWELFR